MSDSEERIHCITIFDIIPPFFGAILGGLLGLLVSWVFGLNAYLCLLIGGYSSPLILFALLVRFANDKNDGELPRSITWRAIRFGLSLYLVIATLALLFLAMWPLKNKLEQLRERERESQPHAPRG